MKRRSSPWQLFVLLLLVAAVAVGGMEYLRREQKKVNTTLAMQVDQAIQAVSDLKRREQALAPGRPARQALEEHLMDASQGNYYSQHLMNLVEAGRESGVEVDPLRFGTPGLLGGIRSIDVSTAVRGTEVQVQEFIRLLEEGKPLGWFISVSYAGAMDPGVSASTNPMEIALTVTMYGP